MAEFLSQDEIDTLLNFVDCDVEYPIFVYTRKHNKTYNILEIDKSFAEELLGKKGGFSESDIYEQLKHLGHTIVLSSHSKKRLTHSIHARYNDLKDASKELKVLKKYLSDNPEYIV